MKRKYVVLRSRPDSPRVIRGVPALPSHSIGEATRGGFSVEVLELRAASQSRGELDFVAAAPSMPMKLIGPVSRVTQASTTLRADSTWGIRAVGADTCSFNGSGTVVAVLDTGIDAKHAAFDGVELIERDFTGEGNGDRDGHGTHCAGTIFGRDVEGVQIGIARGVQKALIGKVIGEKGGPSEAIVSAIQWAVENGAHVISMSLGIDFPGYQAGLQHEGFRPEVATSLALEGYRTNVRLFDRLADLVSSMATLRQPCLLVAASGNESGRDQVPSFEIGAGPPAVSDGFISVAAVQEGRGGFEVAAFSNTGADVSAPGVGILSAKAGGGLIAFDGTSMATPHVAGVAALWAQKLREARMFAGKRFATTVLGSATMTPLAPSQDMNSIGAGIIRAPQ